MQGVTILVSALLVLRTTTVVFAIVAPGVREGQSLTSATLLRRCVLGPEVPDFYCPSLSNGFVSTYFLTCNPFLLELSRVIPASCTVFLMNTRGLSFSPLSNPPRQVTSPLPVLQVTITSSSVCGK